MKVDILEQTRKDIFAVPIFELEVDLKFINIPGDYKPTWESGVNSTYGHRTKIPKETIKYLREKIISCLRQLKDPVDFIEIENVWKNKYDVNDYQGYHSHAKTTWSFIINYSVSDQLNFIYLDYDIHCLQFCKKGFFNFKKNIPSIVKNIMNQDQLF